MKTYLKLIPALCALAVITAGYFSFLRPDGKNTVSESAGDFDLTDQTLEDLTGISWTTDGETRAYTLKEGRWEAAEVSAEPADQEAVEALAERLVNLQATRKIENVDNPENYGLPEPSVTVTAEWKDGRTVYSMGESTPFGDGYYLALSTGDRTVYTIASPLMAGIQERKAEENR